MDAEPGSLEGITGAREKDEASGLGDAPWPPHFRKMEGKPRVMPSRQISSEEAATSEDAAGCCCELSDKRPHLGLER
jgi:hypothetical protein